jgi:hypothetical protein
MGTDKDNAVHVRTQYMMRGDGVMYTPSSLVCRKRSVRD